uniref:USP domain-containing protein n=1 Tax=Macrostomum lignano TaxID=282301 RepID=A0A1I8I193_9PLAT
MQRCPQLKAGIHANFMRDVFDYLFALPSAQQRHLPKCKSTAARSNAIDLLVELAKGGNGENYLALVDWLQLQHTQHCHDPYGWDYWPQDEGRAACGYVGITNLGATCYMATCLQHLFMIPQAREALLQACNPVKHAEILAELKKLFAFLQESQRRALNPRGFCRVYSMNRQSLNTGEQKDMTEFFNDLIAKLEEMTPELKTAVKDLFCGVLTNSVVSQDCPHVRHTLEEFYCVRCEVHGVKNLYQSLDKLCVTDLLEGENMYRCSGCDCKVKAEKRVMFKKLPKILCLNTMRYTFDMVTMREEKVNSHFSFPMKLVMRDYMELSPTGTDAAESSSSPADQQQQQREEVVDKDDEMQQRLRAELPTVAEQEAQGFVYELIGVTVHTGTADGGHYYSYIRDRLSPSVGDADRWLWFNDSEVRPFDPSQIPVECFGGEVSSKAYDSMQDRFMDFSFERTNSAYMLFYEHVPQQPQQQQPSCLSSLPRRRFNFELPPDLADAVWQDNKSYLQDRNIFNHMYFNFMFQVCAYLRNTVPSDDQVFFKTARLTCSFILETLVHAKEKLNLVQWIEIMDKMLILCPPVCDWFLATMAEDDWWLRQILVSCPSPKMREIFSRFCLEVVNKVRQREPDQLSVNVTNFIRMLLNALEQRGMQQHCRHLDEYFTLLLRLSEGRLETAFMLENRAISRLVQFCLMSRSVSAAQQSASGLEGPAETDDELSLDIVSARHGLGHFEKLGEVVEFLLSRAASEPTAFPLFDEDRQAILPSILHQQQQQQPHQVGTGHQVLFPFVFNFIKQCATGAGTRCAVQLVLSACRLDPSLYAEPLVVTLLQGLASQEGESFQNFVKVLTPLMDPGLRMATGTSNSLGETGFAQLVMRYIWSAVQFGKSPAYCVEWLATQAMRNPVVQQHLLESREHWLPTHLVCHPNLKVRQATFILFTHLLPMRAQVRFHELSSARCKLAVVSPCTVSGSRGQSSVEQRALIADLLRLLLGCLTDIRQAGGAGGGGLDRAEHSCFAPYFNSMTLCLVSADEKRMVTPHLGELWDAFFPRTLSIEISNHGNKYAILNFLLTACTDCPENVTALLGNAKVVNQICTNYILSDMEDSEVIFYNRCMLPAYYGLLRLLCLASPRFSANLCRHTNINWSLRFIAPYPTHYGPASEELLRLCEAILTGGRASRRTREDIDDTGRRRTGQMSETATTWTRALQSATRTRFGLREIYGKLSNLLPVLVDAMYTLHTMFFDSEGCFVYEEMLQLLCIINTCLRVGLDCIERHRDGLLRKGTDVTEQLVELLSNRHQAFHSTTAHIAHGLFFPRLQSPPTFQLNSAAPGANPAYVVNWTSSSWPYYQLVDRLARVSINAMHFTQETAHLCAMVAYEGASLHCSLFAKLWNEGCPLCRIAVSQLSGGSSGVGGSGGTSRQSPLDTLMEDSYFTEYVAAVLTKERRCLVDRHIYAFMTHCFPKHSSVTAEKTEDNSSFISQVEGDVKACLLLLAVVSQQQQQQQESQHGQRSVESRTLRRFVPICY